MTGGHPLRTAYYLAAVEGASAVLKNIDRRDQLFPTRTPIPLHLTLSVVSIRSISRAVDLEDNSVAGAGAREVSEQVPKWHTG